MLSETECLAITNAYYSHFCCTALREGQSGVHFICAEERNRKLPGYGRAFSIVALIREDSLVIASAPRYASLLDRWKGTSPEKILTALESTYPIHRQQLMVFHGERCSDFGTARLLSPSDYPPFEAFFREAHPGADPAGWLQAYFDEKSARGIMAGTFRDGRLISVADTPDMPYLPDRIQHTGIATLPAYRRRGYGAWTAGLAVHRLLALGICPQWDCNVHNAASIALAEKIGFRKYGVAYLLEEEPN